MLDIKAALDICYKHLSREWDIEIVNTIPGDVKIPAVSIWKVVIPVFVGGRAEEVATYILFRKLFPYVLPDVFITDDRFRYLPHLSAHTRKLCLYEDGVIYDEENIEGIVRDVIRKTRKWIEYYSDRDNTNEYMSEIRDYWNIKYDGEQEVDDCWILLDEIPKSTCEMTGVAYPVKNMEKSDDIVMHVVARNENHPVLSFVRKKHKTIDFPVLFLASLAIPQKPPYTMTGQNIIERTNSESDRKEIKRFLNCKHSACILFSLGLDFTLGGVRIPLLKTKRSGFRSGALTPFDILTRFEGKYKPLDRLLAFVYSRDRIAERTAGEMMNEKNFLVAGLGSIGSHLCHYLNGYNNAKFTLADTDFLSIDNMGRHLLGFESISQNKALAVGHYLQQYRPDRDVQAVKKKLQQLNDEEINRASVIFVCTGDVMTERWVLHKMVAGEITQPTFMFWLEPYGIAGIMLFVNPTDKERLNNLLKKAKDDFVDYSLIKREESDNREKLIRRDAGCNGSYALYSANDVVMFLSAMFPLIDQLLEEPKESVCYRWVGNVHIANQKGISLISSSGLLKNRVQKLIL